MVDAGAALAVMGNHELNAIAWHTPDPRNSGEYLRPHHSAKWGEKNRKQHAAFLAEVEDKPALHAEIIAWFLSLPLWLDLPELRVVHACWHGSFMAWLSPQLYEGRYLTRDLMVPATDEPAHEAEKDNATPTVFKAVEALTKGIEIPLPSGQDFRDKDGIPRNRVRVRWWDEPGVTYCSTAPRYRSVCTEAWPRSSRICSNSPPAARHGFAAVRRQSCGAIPGTPAAAAYGRSICQSTFSDSTSTCTVSARLTGRKVEMAVAGSEKVTVPEGDKVEFSSAGSVWHQVAHYFGTGSRHAKLDRAARGRSRA
jgi:hypothetical protein